LSTVPPKPLPDIDYDSRAWWDALETGSLEIPRCNSCRRTFFPPQPGCPHCGSASWALVQSEGLGAVYSWVVVHHPFDPAFADEVPYTIVAGDLDEGARLVGRYWGPEVAFEPGMRLRTCAYRAQAQALLGFKPAGQGQ
jgi:uncharacterized OB-fold protein